tara:strand:+ start:2447 stop:2983 length:537 start_codon:yes stop_codon:yes gene_type:complete
MATTIQNFFTRAASKQFSRDFLFRVRQIDLIGGIRFDGEDDLVYARTASLPGRNIDNVNVNYFGQEFQVPGRATYANAAGYSIEFYHDENCELRTKLEAASRAVFNNETSTGAYGMPGEESVINLVQIDKNLNDVRNIELVGASIREISDIEYSIADGTGDVLNFTTTFAYHFYRDFS